MRSIPRGRTALVVTALAALAGSSLLAPAALAAPGASPALAPAAPLPAAPAPVDGMVAWYPLDQASGTTVADASGHGKDATVSGTASWADGAGFRFSGGSASSGNSIKLPDNVLAGLDSVTVSMDAWVDPALTGKHFLYNLGNRAVGDPQSGTGYLFTTATPYTAKISDGAWSREQVTATSANLPRGEWKRLTYTQTGSTAVLYEDGTEVARNTKVTIKPGDIGGGKTTLNMLGASAYASDASFKGLLRDVRIYDHALGQAEVSELTGHGRQDIATKDAQAAAQALKDAGAAIADLTLPASGQGGSRLTWSSSNPNAIEADGTIHRSETDASATLTVTASAGTTTATAAAELTVPGVVGADEATADAALAALKVEGLDDLRTSITLPAKSTKLDVTWSSSQPEILAADGTLTRPAVGQDAAHPRLTATVTKGTATRTRVFETTVPALPQREDPTAYLFTYFTADSVPGEKIYFGASNGNNARDWIDLNGGNPVMTSNLSTKGLRDPFIVRSPEGDRFFLIATDLSIGGGTSWNDSQRSGSKYIEVWESDDLVNWSDQRHVKVSPDNAGNTWAPEAYWDAKLGEYVVFWASKLYGKDDPNHTETSPPNTMMYATTRDFRTFSEAKPWQDTGTSRIDSTVIEEAGTYYRFTKDEGQAYGCLDVFAETSDTLTQTTDKDGGWKMGQKCIGKAAGTSAVEGPTVFKANPGDVNGDGYYLFVDEFGGRKYLPLYSDSLKSQQWSAVTDARLPSPAPRHGTVLPVTATEYAALMSAYLPKVSSVQQSTVSTPPGQEATLPSKVGVSFADGSERQLAVTWDALPQDYHHTAGTYTAQGTIAGLDARASLEITVGEPGPAPALADPLLHYDFSSLTAASAGTTVPDSSSNGNDGVIQGKNAALDGAALTLPGGSATSGAAYVELPRGVFDGQDTLTISLWLRNQTGAGNYAAMFFGDTKNPPQNYWLLNPRNGANQFKSVITGSVSANAPWGTETGFAPTNAGQGMPGAVTTSDWSLFTTVITPGKLTTYLNGKAVGTVDTKRAVSDLGTDLVAYLGKSSYPDQFYKGGIKDVRVNAAAATPAQVAAAYEAGLAPEAIDAVLKADADALSVPSAVTANITLPRTGASGTSISWESTDAAHLSATGKVVRPERDDATLTLTATLSYGGKSVTRAFEVRVLANTVQNNVAQAAAGFDLGLTQAWQDLKLADAVGQVDVAWSSSNEDVLSAAGVVKRGDAAQKVTLTATFSQDGVSEQRTFEVTVLPRDEASAAAYTAKGGTKKTDVLHLALAGADGTQLLANKGRPVLYPTQGSVRFGTPVLFRKADGGFGLIAPEVTSSGATGKAFVYGSADLITFTGESLVALAPGLKPTALSVAYDNATGLYTVSFANGSAEGTRYAVTTADLVTFSKPVRTEAAAKAAKGTARAGVPEAQVPSTATGSSSLALTAGEAKRLSETFGRTVNTAVEQFGGTTLAVGDAVPELPETAKVEYSSGDTSTFPVAWDEKDLAAVDTATPGTYTVNGTVTAPDYGQTLVERRADPDVTLGDDGWYYFTGSYPMVNASDKEGYDRVILRRSKTIAGLKDAEEVTIWHESSQPEANRYIWAPELQKIGDDWYILFTAAQSNDVWSIRPNMLKFTGAEFSGEAVMDAKNWEFLGKVKAAPGDTQAFTHFSLDMTAFEQNGRHYLIWAEKPGASTLRMGEIDPKDPTQLLSASILLAEPTQAWERNDEQNQQVDEGAAVIHHGGKVYVAFSASTVDRNYAVGLLSADENADLMDPASWTKTGYPVLTSDDVPGQMGPGHNSFTIDEYGNPVIVFHSRTENDTSNPGEATDEGLFDPRRHARAATVHFDANGAPVLNMSKEEELDPALAAVSYTVTVKAADAGTDEGADGGSDAGAGSDAGSDANAGSESGSDGAASGGSNAGAGAESGSDGSGATGEGSDANAGAAADGSGSDGGNAGSEADGGTDGGNAGSGSAGGTSDDAGDSSEANGTVGSGGDDRPSDGGDPSAGQGESDKGESDKGSANQADPGRGDLAQTGSSAAWYASLALLLALAGAAVLMHRRKARQQ